VRHAFTVALVLFALMTPVASASPAAPPPIRADDVTAEATSATGASITYHVRAYDPGSGNPISATCTPPGATGSGDFDVTADFPLGDTSVTCTTIAPDYSRTITVHVVDTTPPFMSQPPDVTTSTTNPVGAAVSWDPLTATDIVDGSLTPVCSPTSGSTFPVGATTVTCTAIDSHGNSAQKQFNVMVTLDDTQAPTFTTVPDSQTVEATEPGGAAVTYVTPTATDNSGLPPSISCDHASGSLFSLGATTVTCTATDGAGNAATATFAITVQDTTPPTLSLPGDTVFETESPAGIAVSYAASASDAGAGSISPTCSPASGATFPIATTEVNCSANDGHGNTASGHFDVTVTLVDHTAPVLSGVPSDRVVEANGPGGSDVNFPTPTATDALDGPIAVVTCSPSSGIRFPIGMTTIGCSATDAHGNVGTASFRITVADTTPPNLIVPAARSVYATTPTGIANTVSSVVSFLSAASASDLVDGNPAVTNDASSFLPVGTLTIRFSARDASGNTTFKEVALTVLPPPPAGTPPLPIPPAPKAPAEVRSLGATPLDGSVQLRWQTPGGVDHVIVSRDGAVIYTGQESTYLDQGLRNGTEYRYVVVTVDSAGNRSTGVVVAAVPKRNLLTSPKDGASRRKPPKLVWQADAEADYYNAQVLLNGVKILSVWPTKATVLLHKTWTFEGRKYTLKPGLYQWYVWPGYGARSAVLYGEMLGSRSFRIVR
jgi:flavin reductase (DIM6/NTAB) family NADH-FMN oxidoreductase RutF